MITFTENNMAEALTTEQDVDGLQNDSGTADDSALVSSGGINVDASEINPAFSIVGDTVQIVDYDHVTFKTNASNEQPGVAESEVASTNNKSTKALCSRLWRTLFTFFRGWKTYSRQSVVDPGLSLALLYMTVLGFDSITVGKSAVYVQLLHSTSAFAFDDMMLVWKISFFKVYMC